MEIKDLIEKDASINTEHQSLRRMTDFERLSITLKCKELEILNKISKALDVMAFGEKMYKGI